MSVESIEFPEKSLGLIPPAKPRVDMPQGGECYGFVRKAESLLESGNSFLGPALAPRGPPEHEMRLKSILKQLDGPPRLRLCLYGLTCVEVNPSGRLVLKDRGGIEVQPVLNLPTDSE